MFARALCMCVFRNVRLLCVSAVYSFLRDRNKGDCPPPLALQLLDPSVSNTYVVVPHNFLVGTLTFPLKKLSIDPL